MGDLMRPLPRRSFVDHAVAVIRWIGIGRLAAIGASVLAVVAGSFWLLRGPESAGSDRAAPEASVPAPTMPSAAGAAAPGDADPAADASTTTAAPTTTPGSATSTSSS